MIDTKEFTAMRKELEKADTERESAIALTREIVKTSKRIIYAGQRDDLKGASQMLPEIKKQIKQLEKYEYAAAHVAKQEYVEALAFIHFLEQGTLVTRKECGVDTESYLLGLCDLTGELMRKSVTEVINKNTGAVYIIQELVAGIYDEFLQFNLRNGELRKKSDSIKWNLHKIEDIIYQLELRD